MKKRFLCVALAPALVALGGCSALGINFSDDKAQYNAAQSRTNLEVPPDLAPIPQNDRFDIPARRGAVSANDEAMRAQAQAQPEVRADNIVQKTTVAKMMKDGNTRWLHVNVDAQHLWPIVQDFWGSVGLNVASQDAKTGYMETGWAENKAKLPQDIIRATLGKVIDFAYSTGERDQYRARLERNDDGTTDVFLTHRSMVEVMTGHDKESSRWQPGPSDPLMEAEMLQRLAVHIENEFNPQKKAAEKAEVPVQDVTPQQALSTPVKDAVGKLVAVDINEPFDRAWRTLGLVVDRMGFEVIDRDRSSGYYLVRYLDPKYEQQKKSERGFFSKVFNSDAAVEAPQYRLHLDDNTATSRLTVQGPDGGSDPTGVSSNILTLLAEQLR